MKKTNISNYPKDDTYPREPVVKNGDSVCIGRFSHTKVLIRLSKVSAIRSTGIRLYKNCSDIILDDGSIFRVQISIKKLCDLLGLSRIHDSAAAKISKIKCHGRNEETGIYYLKVKGSHDGLPIAVKNRKAIEMIKGIFKPC